MEGDWKMSLKEQLALDFKAAMKEKDLVRKEIVQLVRAGILQVEKDEQIEADDKVALAVIQREVKKRRELLAEIGTDRPDLSEKAEGEIAILEAYLPEQLDEAKLTTIIREQIEVLGASSMKDMGRVMKAVLPLVQGQADGGEVSRIIKGILG